MTVTSPTFALSARNSRRTKSACSEGLVMGHTDAPRHEAFSAGRPGPWHVRRRSARLPAWFRQQVGGGLRDEGGRVLARFPRGLKHHDALVGEQRGASSSASSLVLTSPARRRSTGTSSVPACLRARRRTAATARSTSSSSSPNTRCRPATASLTQRSCHDRTTVPTTSTRAGTSPPHRSRCVPTTTAKKRLRRYPRRPFIPCRADPMERRRKRPNARGPPGHPQQPPQSGPRELDQQPSAGWPERT